MAASDEDYIDTRHDSVLCHIKYSFPWYVLLDLNQLLDIWNAFSSYRLSQPA